MTVSNLPNEAEASHVPGAITQGLLAWKANGGVGPRPFGGNTGAEAASLILLRVQALTSCMAEALNSSAENAECEFGLLSDAYKAMALDGIGDLVLLAKALIDEA